jgi:hypothetical protein
MTCLTNERRQKAIEWERREGWHREAQEYLLDQIVADGIQLRRFRTLLRALVGVAP